MVALLDAWGRPVRRAALRREHAGPTLTGVRQAWIGRDHLRGLTPARLASILREAEVPGDGAEERYLELAEQIEERDLHYLGVLGTRKRQVAQIGVRIEPASDAAMDIDDADLVRPFFQRGDLEDELIDLLDAIGKGYAVAEIEWETSAHQWMPRRLMRRDPRHFSFDRRSGTSLRLRADDGGWIEPPPWTFVFHTAAAKSGLPIRGGLARAAAWSWLAKHATLADWVRFAEAYGQPLRLGRYGPGATDADLATLRRAVRDLGVDAAAVIPDDMNVEFVDGAGTGGPRAELYRDLVTYMDAQISIAVLGQTLTTQEGDSGSYALGQVHNLVRADIERSDARQIAGTLTRDIVVPIVALNRGPRAHYPRAVIERASAPDLAMLADSLQRLVPLGLRVSARQVRDIFGLDAPDSDDEVLGAAGAPPAGAPPAEARDTGRDGARAAIARTGTDDDPVPAWTGQAHRLIDPIVAGWIDAAREQVDAAATLADLRDHLDASEDWMVVAAPMTGVFAQALATTHLAGLHDVLDETGLLPETTATAATAATAAVSAQLPFDEQISFFRDKTDLTTERWTDIWQEAHDRSFTVAGAASDDLVADLREAVDAAIGDGETLERFRARFDDIVKRHGWDYRGARAWRTEVIYATNLRTSYAAGRYRQMKEVAQLRPWWRYRHSDASENPRPEHVAWDGTVLAHDDPWWDQAYPPNGFGCRCYVETLSRDDLERLGKTGPDPAPDPGVRRQRMNPVTGRMESVLPGIDPGWAYAPGRSTLARPPAPPRPSPDRQPPRPSPDRQPPPDAPPPNDLAAAVRAGDPDPFIDAGREFLLDLVRRSGGDPAAPGFAVAIRKRLRERLRRDRGAGDIAPILDPGSRRDLADEVAAGSRDLPASWIRRGNQDMIMVDRVPRGAGFLGDYQSRPASGGLPRIRIKKNRGTALHEYVHHVQAGDPALDRLFQEVHKRRNKDRAKGPLKGYRGIQGREDEYIDAYFGAEYDDDMLKNGGYDQDSPALEVITRALQLTFHSMATGQYQIVNGKLVKDTIDIADLARDDPEMLELVLGVLMYYDPL